MRSRRSRPSSSDRAGARAYRPQVFGDCGGFTWRTVPGSMWACGRQLTNRSSRRPPQHHYRAPPSGNPRRDGEARVGGRRPQLSSESLAGRRYVVPGHLEGARATATPRRESTRAGGAERRSGGETRVHESRRRRQAPSGQDEALRRGRSSRRPAGVELGLPTAAQRAVRACSAVG